MKTIILASLFFLGVVFLGGCDQAAVNQSSACTVEGWDPAMTIRHCRPGQKIAFLPQRWGNEQLPIMFAAANCDLRYQVALTNGGVTCIFQPVIVPRNS